MGLQEFIDTMNDMSSRERSNYHLTYGDLVKVLKEAPKEATFDPRVKGIGSYRGYYVDIAFFTEDHGYSVEDEAYDFDNYSDHEAYEKWRQEHVTGAESLPTNANELGALLESLIGKDFTGWKGGNYTIAEDKPLWLETEAGSFSQQAVVGIDKDLNLITKEIEL